MKTLARVCAILLSVSCLHAGDGAATDPDLPQPLDLSFADTLLADSPFSRSVNLEESLQLTSIAYVDGRPVATVLNKTTKESVLVFEEPNALGWRLTGAVAGTDLNNTRIEMMVGPEHITMHYHGQQISPGTEANGGSKTRLAGSPSGKKGSGKVSIPSLLAESDRALHASLSPDARGKLKKLIRSQIEKTPDMTREQSSAYAQKVFAKIKETDRPPTSPKPPKSGKAVKRKQGA